jgi:hypothetical protein
MNSEPQQVERAALLQELIGRRCRCGSDKAPRHTFCGRCYYALTLPTRRALYLKIGAGYEAAYTVAVEILTRAGRIKTQ